MSKVRYYFELSPLVIDRFDGHQYLTAQVKKPYDGWMPRISSHGPGTFHQLLVSSDRVILCEGDSIRYIKHREMDPQLAVVDPEEFFEIKMKSVEFG